MAFRISGVPAIGLVGAAGLVALAGVTATSSAMAQSASRTRLLSLQNPSSAGAPVTLRAEVDGLGGGAPTGMATFWDGTTPLGAAALGPIGAGQATLAAGAWHSCALTAAGGVKCWGNNDSGLLGDGTTTRRLTPVDVTRLTSGVIAVAAGGGHSCALTAAGGVKCWGANHFGELGDGTKTSRLAPVDVNGLTRGGGAIAAGAWHSCALTVAGGVKCWGLNNNGELGDGSQTQRLTPADVSGLTRGGGAIAAGDYHNCALTSAGAVKCWGANGYGELGDGTTMTRLTPVTVSGLTRGLVAIAAGNNHSCALTAAGGVKCWGRNDHGQLGDRTRTTRLTPVDVFRLTSGVVAITAGSSHNCALTAEGGVKCWGSNTDGQLGIGTSSTGAIRPIEVSGLSQRVVAIAAGGGHSCALIVAGAIKCWGRNTDGQLGDGSSFNRVTPVDTQNIAGLLRARADFTTPPLAAGRRVLRVRYPGDATHAGSLAGVSQLVR